MPVSSNYWNIYGGAASARAKPMQRVACLRIGMARTSQSVATQVVAGAKPAPVSATPQLASATLRPFIYFRKEWDSNPWEHEAPPN